MSAAINSNKNPTARDEAKKFLADLVQAEPVPANEILEQAKANGINEKTLYRAKGDLGIISYRDGPNGEWRWHPPDPQWRGNQYDRD